MKYMLMSGFVDALNEWTTYPWVQKVIEIAWEIIFLLLVWVIGRKVVKILCGVIDTVLTKREIEISVKKFLVMALKWFMYIVLVLFMFEHVSGTTVSLVAIIGSLSVTIGLALQGSLSNVAGGVLILMMRPFRVGDYIVYGGDGGTVCEIGLIYTRLKTPDCRSIVIPNGSLANGMVVNVSAYPVRRVDRQVSVSYSCDIEKAKKILSDMLMEYTHRENDDITVCVSSLADSAVILEMRMFVPADFYWDAYFYMNENCKKVLDENGIAIPFPQLDVHTVLDVPVNDDGQKAPMPQFKMPNIAPTGQHFIGKK